MSRPSQDRSPRLAIVGSTDKKKQSLPAAPRWWGPQRAHFLSLNLQDPQPTPPDQATAASSRVVAMPMLPRGMSVLVTTWNFLRSYFVDGAKHSRGAVLSFRRHGWQARGMRRAVAAADLPPRKSNGSVGWNAGHKVAPQEGGRG